MRRINPNSESKNSICRPARNTQTEISRRTTEVAIKLAKEAFNIKPAHIETQDILLQLQAESGDWRERAKRWNKI